MIERIEKLEARVKELEEAVPSLPDAVEEPEQVGEAALAVLPEEEKGYSPADTGMKVADIIAKLCAFADDDIIIVSDGQITIFSPDNLVKDVVDVHDQLASG